MSTSKKQPSTITRISFPTKHGNSISVFYNAANELLVIDVMHKNEVGGIELLRRTLNEVELLKHCT